MFRILIALVVGCVTIYSLINSKPTISEDNAGNITAITRLAETPGACDINNDLMTVTGIYYSHNGHDITQVHFSDRSGVTLAIPTNFYKLPDADAARAREFIKVSAHYQVSDV